MKAPAPIRPAKIRDGGEQRLGPQPAQPRDPGQVQQLCARSEVFQPGSERRPMGQQAGLGRRMLGGETTGRRPEPVASDDLQAILAGLAAGVFSGAVAATVYGLSCAESTATFVATWYTLGMVLSGALGAAVGRWVLRW